jgi:hypothetical protein
MSNVSLLLSRLQAAAGLVLVLAALLLNPWFIEANVVRDGTLEQKTYVLAADALLLVLGLILIMRVKNTRATTVDSRSVQIAVAALLISAGVALLLAEAAVRIALDPQHLFGADEDGWWQLRWQASQSLVADDALTPEAFSFDIHDPVLGWSPKPGFRSDNIRINSRGVRADREYPLDKMPESLRVVVVGDSFTWGEDVANEDTFVTQLEKIMPDTEAINLGVRGFGTDQQLLRLKREGLVYNPDVVILIFYEGNINRNILSFRDFGKPRFSMANNYLELMNQPVPTREEYHDMEVALPSFRIGKLATNAWMDVVTATKLHPPLEEQKKWKITSAILGEARRASESAGAQFLLGYIADSESVVPGELEQVMADWADATGTHFINFGDVYRARPGEEWEQIYQGHLTPYGNRLTAETIAAKLRALGLESTVSTNQVIRSR